MEPVWKIPGLAIISILPFGSSAAGPSAMPRLPGKSGPAVHDTRVRVVNGGVGCGCTCSLPWRTPCHWGAKELDLFQMRRCPVHRNWLPSPRVARASCLQRTRSRRRDRRVRNSFRWTGTFGHNKSTVRTFPLGSRVQVSSSLMSNLPLPVAVHVKFDGLKSAAWRVTAWASIICPLLNTMLEASPIEPQPVGGLTVVQVLATGS